MRTAIDDDGEDVEDDELDTTDYGRMAKQTLADAVKAEGRGNGVESWYERLAEANPKVMRNINRYIDTHHNVSKSAMARGIVKYAGLTCKELAVVRYITERRANAKQTR